MRSPRDYDTPFVPTPFLMTQYLSFHEAIVKDVKDPWGVGRVRAGCPDLLGTGKENWTGWLQVIGNPVGGKSGDGDQGTWLPLQPEQTIYVGFLAGHPSALFAIPGPAFQRGQVSGKDRNKQLAPKEVKAAAKQDPRQAARLFIPIKTPAGHTPILADDRGGHEFMASYDWTGAGKAYLSPGLVEDDEEKEGEESKPRKGARRGVRTALTEHKKPSELLKDGIQVIGDYDMNGSGTYTVAKDNEGTLIVVASSAPDKCENYFVLDTKNKRTIMGAGQVQIVCDAENGHVYTTSMIIQNQPPIDVAPLVKMVRDKIAEREREYAG